MSKEKVTAYINEVEAIPVAQSNAAKLKQVIQRFEKEQSKGEDEDGVVQLDDIIGSLDEFNTMGNAKETFLQRLQEWINKNENMVQ